MEGIYCSYELAGLEGIGKNAWAGWYWVFLTGLGLRGQVSDDSARSGTNWLASGHRPRFQHNGRVAGWRLLWAASLQLSNPLPS